MAETAFRAKFNGSCAAGRACRLGGRIMVGQPIIWNRKRRGIVWHAECHTPDAPYTPPPSHRAPAEEAPADGQPQGNGQPAEGGGGEGNPEEGTGTGSGESQESGERSGERGESKQPQPQPQAPPPDDPLVKALVEKLQPYFDKSREIDTAALQREIERTVGNRAQKTLEALREEIAAVKAEEKPVRIEIVDPKLPEEIKDLGLQHEQFPLLIKLLQARTADGHRVNVWMTGPAGSGKTTAALNAAKALGLEYAFTGAIDTPYPLLGFVDAHGKVIPTPFRHVYENGGVFLFDEYDGSHPSATLPFNAALANGHCAFPDRIVERHKDFVAIAAANTWGLGGTGDYVGRNRLDAASLDRFVTLPWGVDEKLELATAGNKEWTRRVQAVRRNVAKQGIRVLITPRASYFGAALLATGLDQAEVERIVLRKSLTDDQWSAVC